MEDVWIIGSDPVTNLGGAWSFAQGCPSDLRRPYGISFDEVDIPKLGPLQQGDSLEVNGRQVRVVARTRGITGFITMPYLFSTLDTARELAPLTPGTCSFFLLKLRAGADVLETQLTAQRLLPDAAVYTPQEFASISQDYWMRRTGIGLSFGASTALGLLVGVLMVGQSLYALALDHVDEYATLKTLGADDRTICSVILVQAITLAIVGSLVGVAVTILIRWSWNSPLAPIEMPAGLIAAAVSIVFIICLAASLLPYWRIRRVDPAIVLSG
jgi:putative ABC transport system permease protein